MNRILPSLIILTGFLAAAASPRHVSFHPCYKHYSVADGLPNNQIRQIIELPDRQMLVASEGFFSLFNGKDFVLQSCNLDSVYRLPDFGAHSHLWQGDSLLWIKDFYCLYLYNAKEKQFRYHYNRYLKNPVIQRFIHEKGDSVTKAQTERTNLSRDIYREMVRGTSLEAEWLQTCITDRQGGKWMGLQNGGVLYVPPIRPHAAMLQLQEGEVIRQLASIDDSILLLGGTKGLYVYDRVRKKVLKTLVKGNLSTKYMAADQLGRIWVSTYDGLFCYHQGECKNYTRGLPHSHTRFAQPLADGRILVCSVTHDLGILTPETMHYELLNGKISQLKDYRTIVAATMTADKHRIAVCTQNGVFLLNLVDKRIEELRAVKPFSKYTNKYNCCFLDHRKQLWLGTQNGLLCLTPTTTGKQTDYQARRFDSKDGLSNACIMSITEDRRGRIWVGTALGINRLEMKNGAVEILSLGKTEGVPMQEFIESGVCRIDDETLCFTSPEGVCKVQVKDFDTTQPPLPVVLVGMRVKGNEVATTSDSYQLSYDENYFEFDISALNYANPDHTRYRYRMKGLDSEWHTLSGSDGMATVSYQALAPGEYQLIVESANGTGKWGGTLRKTIVICPPLWFTWWAKTFYLLMTAVALCSSIAFYIRRKKKKMERENDERVNRLFELRDEARHHFSQNVNIEPAQLTVSKEEENLVEKMMEVIGEHIGDTDYTVDRLASDVCMSRTSLYKKTQQMLGITPNDFLRSVRLKQAFKLLTETDIPVNQVALMVGFQTPRYFRQCFKQAFGMNPSDLKEQKEG